MIEGKAVPLIFIVIVLLMSFLRPVQTQDSTSPNKTNWDVPDRAYTFDFPHDKILLKDQMVAAVLRQLTFCKRRLDGHSVLLGSCARHDCENRINLFVGYIIEAGEKYNLNPWMLAAMAYNESRFNPFAVGIVHERGIFQMNPASKRGKKTRFVQDAVYRRSCKNIPGNCQEDLVNLAAEHIRSAIDKCGGSWVGGLSMYNGGTCGIRAKYVYKTRKVWKALEKESSPKLPWCDRPRDL